MNQPLSVSQFVNLIDDSLKNTGRHVVGGEVSGFKIKDDKWVLFELKDENSRVSCFMTAWTLNAQIEDGMLVQATGQGTLKKWGQFSFNIDSIKPTGEGALKRAYELLRAKLDEEGLFAPERKRALTKWPKHIALVTSRDAAAYTDFLKVLKSQVGGIEISLIHSLVQGDNAPEQVVKAIETANTRLNGVDVLVLIRGGGSMEDLQAFNDERVVRAVATSRITTVVGIGHERDVTLAELVSDIRASTPSVAAEIVGQSWREAGPGIAMLKQSLRRSTHDAWQRQRGAVREVTVRLKAEVRQAQNRVQMRLDRLTDARGRLRREVKVKGENLEQLKRLLSSLSPGNTLKRGYSITRLQSGQLIKQASEVKAGQKISTQLAVGNISSTIDKL